MFSKLKRIGLPPRPIWAWLKLGPEQPWQRIRFLRQVLGFVALGVLSLGTFTSYLCLRHYHQTGNLRLSLPLCLALLVLVAVFLYLRYLGNQQFILFMQDVALRKSQNRSLQLPASHTQALRQVLLFSHHRILYLLFIVVAAPFTAAGVHQYLRPLRAVPSPEAVSRQLSRLIRQKQAHLQTWQKEQNKFARQQAYIRQQAARVWFHWEAGRQSQQEQEQQWRMVQQNRLRLEKLYQQAQKLPEIAQRERFIRQNSELLAQTQGELEARLALADEEEAQAEVLLQSPGKLWDTFVNMLVRQDRYLQKALKGLESSRKKQQALRTEAQKYYLLAENIKSLRAEHLRKMAQATDSLGVLQKKMPRKAPPKASK
ncbi:MAG: hypothetical protein HC913_11315 [Microscillaceae bacterium]|nr:hypothetical protein [Microscillaceae bacterium]